MSGNVCKKCGLPAELCVCKEVAKDEQSNIRIFIERRKWGKEVTVISGIDDRNLDLKKLTKKLKTKMASGGTYKDGRIELQGNHLFRIKDVLAKEGFDKSSIEIMTWNTA